MHAIILGCKANAQFRLGKSSLDNTAEFIHSDTLFSALLNSYALLYDKAKTDAFIDSFEAEEGIAISSAFHCLEYQEGKYLHFFPKALIFEKHADPHKQNKKVKFLSYKLLQEKLKADTLAYCAVLGGTHAISMKELLALEICTYKELEQHMTEAAYRKYKKQKKSLAEIKEKQLRTYFDYPSLNRFLSSFKLSGQSTYPKVHVHKVGQEAAYYTQTNLQLQSWKNIRGKELQTHFYFLIKGINQLNLEEQKRLRSALNLLADEGIGGDRSTGTGQIDYIKETPFDWEVPKRQKHHLSLSLSIPETDAAFSQFQAYRFLKRGGGLIYGENARNQRRKIRMISEGAISKGKMPAKGSIRDVSPGQNRSILRNGIHFSIPVQYAEK